MRPLWIAVLLILSACGKPIDVDQEALGRAEANSYPVQESFQRCHRYLDGWLEKLDPESGLIPRNLDSGRDLWVPQDSAADNYPFMVLTAFLTDRPLLEGRMKELLASERRLTNRLGTLPDFYSFSQRGFSHPEPDLDRITFGASEYIKDGLLPVTELMGPSPWSRRLIEMLDDLWARASYRTPYGLIPSDSHEINGEMLQVLSRVYWMTGDPRYLEWALRLGDYYLLGEHHPTRDADRLRLRDHGCEVISGLCELYATVGVADPERREAYREPLHRALDRILEVGRNPDGMFFNVINPRTGDVIDEALADTWGYTLNGYYTVYRMDGVDRYREAVLRVLQNLDRRYPDYDWERGSADGDADAVESALNLLNREYVGSAASWVDRQIRTMWSKQQDSGIIEGWHGDGNFARTSIMYAFWKSAGVRAEPWRTDLRWGGEISENMLYLYLTAEVPWDGRVVLDGYRHRDFLKLPFDWPRINQFPEWYPVDPEGRYSLYHVEGETVKEHLGADLLKGVPVKLDAGEELRWLLVPEDPGYGTR